MKKLFGFTVLLLCGIAVAQASDVLSIQNLDAPRGGKAVLSVNLENDQEITAFSFDLYLPDGVTVVGQNLTARKDNTHSLSANCVNGVWKFACFSSATAAFSKSEGSVCDIYLMVDRNVELGNKTIDIKNIELSNTSAQATNPANISCSLNAIDYEDGYSISMLPFAFSEDVDGLEYVLSSEKNLTQIEFEISFPDSIGSNQLYTVTKKFSNTIATTSIDDDEHGGVKVFIARKGSNTVKNGNVIAKLEIGYDSNILKSGVLSMTIYNIYLTDVDNVTHFAAPTSTSIFVGESPKAVPENETVTLAGEYNEDNINLLVNSIPESGFNTLDLTGVTSLPEDTEIPVPANTLIWTSTDLGLEQDNVIVDNVCENLSLSDGASINIQSNFTATNAEYTRPMAQTGIYSMYLPFAVSAPSGAKLLVFDKFQDAKLYFNEVDQVDAYTPCLVNFSGTTEFKATSAGAAITTQTPQTGSFVGTLVEIPAPNAQGYYTLFANGTGFGVASDKASIPAFRSFYKTESSKSPSFMSLVIDNGVTQVEIPVEKLSEQDIYNITGVMVNESQNHGLFIKGGKKYYYNNK